MRLHELSRHVARASASTFNPKVAGSNPARPLRLEKNRDPQRQTEPESPKAHESPHRTKNPKVTASTRARRNAGRHPRQPHADFDLTSKPNRELTSRRNASTAPANTSERNLCSRQRFGPRGWSVYGALRAQPVATGGRCAGKPAETSQNRCRRLAPVADRRWYGGSTVRVRQRASRSRCIRARFRLLSGRLIARSTSTKRPQAWQGSVDSLLTPAPTAFRPPVSASTQRPRGRYGASVAAFSNSKPPRSAGTPRTASAISN